VIFQTAMIESQDARTTRLREGMDGCGSRETLHLYHPSQGAHHRQHFAASQRGRRASSLMPPNKRRQLDTMRGTKSLGMARRPASPPVPSALGRLVPPGLEWLSVCICVHCPFDEWLAARTRLAGEIPACQRSRCRSPSLAGVDPDLET
jgi:hypothetical protein